MKKTSGLTLLSVMLVLVVAVAAQARPPLPPALQIELWTDAPGDAPQLWNPPGVPNGDGTWDYTGNLLDPDGHWDLDWVITADADPFVSAGFQLVNTSASTLTFNLITSVPISPIITPSSLMGGSTGGSITDANFDGIGTVSTAPGLPFYTGMIDGSPVLPLYSDPNSWSVTFAGETVNIPAISTGLPGPTIPGPAAFSSIGIHHTFTLTPGDRVAATSFFVVTPEPATLSLLLFGVFALKRRRH